jgi:hypothetical protein
MKKLSLLAALVLSAALTACSSAEEKPEGIIQPADGVAPNFSVAYEKRIEQYSAGDTEYAGLYNNFEYKATLYNSFIRDQLLDRQAGFYQWDAAKKTAERDKAISKSATETQVFLSFFTPDHKNDNLADSKTIWNLYLEVGGQRYSGKVTRSKQLLAEIQSLFPYANRWGTAYYVTFPVATNVVETQISKMTITGPLGTRAIEFAAMR